MEAAKQVKILRVPMLLFGSDFWKKVVDFKAMQTKGTVHLEDLACFQYVETPEQAWSAIQAFHPMSL